MEVEEEAAREMLQYYFLGQYSPFDLLLGRKPEGIY